MVSGIYVGEDEGRQERHVGFGKALRRGALWTACMTFLLLTPDSVAAQGNIHIGQLRVHPFLAVTDTVSDNIYFTSTEEKRDSFVTYMPGVKLELPIGQHKTEAEYHTLVTRYKKYKGEDTTDHHARGMVNFKIGRLFEARFSDVFLKGHEGRNASATGFVQTFRTNTADTALVYQLMRRSKIEVSYSKSTWDFLQSESEFRNRDEDLVSGFFYYRFLPKTSAFIEIDRKTVQYEFNTAHPYDNVVETALLGLTWEMSESSRGTVKGGVLNKDFESPALEDYSDWIGSVDLQHQFSRYSSLTLLGQRTVSEAVVRDTRYVVTTGLFAEFAFRVYGKLTAKVGGSYGRDEFSDRGADVTEREDKTTTGAAAFKYSIRDWLALEAGYTSKKRTSNIPAHDYIEHSYMGSASAIF